MKRYIYKGSAYASEHAVRAAVFEAERKALPTIVDDWGRFKVELEEWEPPKPPAPTPEQLAAQALAQAKADRAEAVEKIVVEVDGMKFDGDESAQGRIGRTIAAAMALGVELETTFRTWVLADNTVAQVTISQLAKALELAGEAQTELWTKPYEAE